MEGKEFLRVENFPKEISMSKLKERDLGAGPRDSCLLN